MYNSSITIDSIIPYLIAILLIAYLLITYRHKLRVNWHSSVDRMDWQEFQHLCADILREQGYKAKVNTLLKADGGRDVKATKGEQTFLVQCKRYKRTASIGVSDIRELYGVATAFGTGAIFMCTCSYTKPARAFAKKVDMLLYDYNDITKWK